MVSPVECVPVQARSAPGGNDRLNVLAVAWSYPRGLETGAVQQVFEDVVA